MPRKLRLYHRKGERKRKEELKRKQKRASGQSTTEVNQSTRTSIMDIKPDLMKEEPESVDFIHSEIIIKTESECDVFIDDFKAERDVDIENQINKILGTSIKQELDDEMCNTNVKKEDVPAVKEEPNTDDDTEYKLPQIKTEELMLKSDSEDYDSAAGSFKKIDLDAEILVTNNKNLIEKGDLIQHNCDWYDFKAYRKSHLESHILANHDKTALEHYSCDHCDYVSRYRSHFNIHVKAIHYKKQCGCDHCKYRSHYKGELKDHVLTRHNKNPNKKYNCHLCEYSCQLKYDLKRHVLREHIKQYVCDHCDYRSHYKRDLNDHVSIKHNKNAITKYNCHLCNYGTHLKYILRRHLMQMHDPRIVKQYGCNHCDYRSINKSLVNNHVLTQHN